MIQIYKLIAIIFPFLLQSLEIEKNYVQDFSTINRDIYIPTGNIRNAIQIKGEDAVTLDYLCSNIKSRHLTQEDILGLFQNTKTQKVKKNAEVLATRLNQHLIDILKSIGGLYTFVSETNNHLITLVTAPWGDTQPIYENDWLIISPKQAYVIAQNEFNLTYSIIEGN